MSVRKYISVTSERSVIEEKETWYYPPSECASQMNYQKEVSMVVMGVLDLRLPLVAKREFTKELVAK